MSKIPCKKCTNCGLYNDITINVCECGTDITNVPSLLVDEDIPMELYGEINEELTYYVQKCSACGALNFTIDPTKKVKVCYNCHKSRVYFVTPVLYVDEEEAKRKEEEEKSPSSLSAVRQLTQSDEVQEEQEESGPWSELLGNIKQATGQSSIDNREEEEVIDWADVLEDDTDGHSQPVQSQTSELTLTSIGYGQISRTFKADDVRLPILLGRSAELGDFLMADGRVGNKHCYISYKNGAWYVTDNNSANGTAINQKDIGLNGERKLINGDALKLGHNSDSIEFRVTIK